MVLGLYFTAQVYGQSSMHNIIHSMHDLAYPNKCTGSKRVSRLPLSEDGTEGNEILSIIAPKPPLHSALKRGKEKRKEKKEEAKNSIIQRIA